MICERQDFHFPWMCCSCSGRLTQRHDQFSTRTWCANLSPSSNPVANTLSRRQFNDYPANHSWLVAVTTEMFLWQTTLNGHRDCLCGRGTILLPQNSPKKHVKVHGNSTSLFRRSCVVNLCNIKADGVELSYIWLSCNASTFKHNFIYLSMKYTLVAIFVKPCKRTVSCKKQLFLFCFQAS